MAILELSCPHSMHLREEERLPEYIVFVVTCVSSCLLESCEERDKGRGGRGIRKENRGEKERGKEREGKRERVGGKEREGGRGESRVDLGQVCWYKHHALEL